MCNHKPEEILNELPAAVNNLERNHISSVLSCICDLEEVDVSNKIDALLKSRAALHTRGHLIEVNYLLSKLMMEKMKNMTSGSELEVW